MLFLNYVLELNWRSKEKKNHISVVTVGSCSTLKNNYKWCKPIRQTFLTKKLKL